MPDSHPTREAQTVQQRLAAAVAAARPKHTRATLAAQRARINAWVRLWQTNARYRRDQVEAALGKKAGLAFERRKYWQEEA